MLIVFANNIVVIDNDEEIKNLRTEFEINELRTSKYFLGIEVAKSKEGIVISRHKYTLDLLKEIEKLGTKPTHTPIEQNHGLYSERES